MAAEPKRKPSPLPPGWKRTSAQYIDEHYAFLEWMVNTRVNSGKGDRATFKECLEDLINLGRHRIDPVTARPKLDHDPADSAEKIIVLPPRQHFSNEFNCNQVFDEDYLAAETDKSYLMVYLAGSDLARIHVNRNVVAFTGRSPAHLLGWAWTEQLHPDDRDWCIENLRDRHQSREGFEYMYRLKRRSGEWAYVLDWVGPRYRPDGSFAGYIGTMHQTGAPGSPLDLLACTNGQWNRTRGQIMPAMAPLGYRVVR